MQEKCCRYDVSTDQHEELHSDPEHRYSISGRGFRRKGAAVPSIFREEQTGHRGAVAEADAPAPGFFQRKAHMACEEDAHCDDGKGYAAEGSELR